MLAIVDVSLWICQNVLWRVIIAKINTFCSRACNCIVSLMDGGRRKWIFVYKIYLFEYFFHLKADYFIGLEVLTLHPKSSKIFPVLSLVFNKGAHQIQPLPALLYAIYALLWRLLPIFIMFAVKTIRVYGGCATVINQRTVS